MRLVPLLAAVVLCVFTVAVGCRKKVVVYTDRNDDPKYRQQLKSLHSEQKQVAKARGKILAEMEEFRKRAAVNLGGNPTPEQIDYELNAYPARYPGWQDLVAKDSACADEMKKKLAEARANVRARLIQEKADREAVKDGRAKAAK